MVFIASDENYDSLGNSSDIFMHRMNEFSVYTLVAPGRIF